MAYTPSPYGIDTNVDSILKGYSGLDKYKDMFEPYNPAQERFAQAGFMGKMGNLQGSLLSMAMNNRRQTAMQGFAGGPTNMFQQTPQYNALRDQQGMLGLALNKNLYGLRQDFRDDTYNRLADLISNDADIKKIGG